MFCSLCFTSAVSNKLYYTGDEPKMWRTWIIFLPQWLAVSLYRYEILDIDTSSALSKLGIILMSSSIAIKLVKRFVVLNNENKCIATLNLRWFYVNKLNRYILYIEIFGDPPLTRAGKMETVHWCTRRRAGTNKTGAKARENIQCKIGIRFVHLYLWVYLLFWVAFNGHLPCTGNVNELFIGQNNSRFSSFCRWKSPTSWTHKTGARTVRLTDRIPQIYGTKQIQPQPA